MGKGGRRVKEGMGEGAVRGRKGVSGGGGGGGELESVRAALEKGGVYLVALYM